MQPSVVSCVARRPYHYPARTNHIDTRNSFRSIDSMTIFKNISANSSSNAPEKYEVLVAIMTPQLLRTTHTGQGLQDNGVLNSDGATLLYDLNQHGDCNAEFMCEVQGVNNQGERLVSNIMFQPQRDDGSLATVKFDQLLSLVQQLASKVDSFENRKRPIEDSYRNIEQVEYALTNMSALLASIESRQSSDLANTCPQLNLTEAIGWETLRDRLLSDTLSSHNELVSIVRQMESTIYNSTVEALSSMRDSSSVTPQGADLSGSQQSDTSRPSHPHRWERGMDSVQPHDSAYLYPVIEPKNKRDLDAEYLCDMVTDGGGWIVIQRRATGDTNFTRGWYDYKTGFGAFYHDFWLGNDKIHILTSEGNWELRIDVRTTDEKKFAIYKDFSIADEQDKYRLSVGEHSGSLDDSLSYHNDMQFTTFDNDNDDWPTGNCAWRRERGGWWYNSWCAYTDLNGLWSDRRPRIECHVEWYGFRFLDHGVQFTEMKIRRQS